MRRSKTPRQSEKNPRAPMKSASQRGYGSAHQKARKEWAKLVEAGATRCTRCKRPILPGSEWHLDHSANRQYYRGPSHAFCNRRAGGRVGAAVTNMRKRARRRVSRAW